MRSLGSMATTREQWSNPSLSRSHLQRLGSALWSVATSTKTLSSFWMPGFRGFIAFAALTFPLNASSMRAASSTHSGAGGRGELGAHRPGDGEHGAVGGGGPKGEAEPLRVEARGAHRGHLDRAAGDPEVE